MTNASALSYKKLRLERGAFAPPEFEILENWAEKDSLTLSAPHPPNLKKNDSSGLVSSSFQSEVKS